MKKIFLLILVGVCCFTAFSQPYKDGIYKFKFFDSEYNKVCGICKVIIKGNSISIYAEEDCHRRKGEVIEKGIIMKHKTGQWIVGHNKKDILFEDIGGCGDGPPVIDFKKKIFYTC